MHKTQLSTATLITLINNELTQRYVAAHKVRLYWTKRFHRYGLVREAMQLCQLAYLTIHHLSSSTTYINMLVTSHHFPPLCLTNWEDTKCYN